MHRPPTFEEVCIDRVGTYWNARPCNLRQSSRPVGSPDYFAEVERLERRFGWHLLVTAELPQAQDVAP